MLLQSSITLLAAASAANALKDASPFFLLSTEQQHSNGFHSQQLSPSAHIESTLSQSLSTTCDSNVYIFIEHPGLQAADLRHGDAMPKMQRRLKADEYKTVVQIPEVMGEVDIARIADLVSKSCGLPQTSIEDVASARKGSKAVITIQHPILRGTEQEIRRQNLQDTDSLLHSQLSSILANHTAHTILYFAVPVSERHESELHWEQEDEPSFQSGMHTDLKRDVDSGFRRRQESGSKNPQDGLPLFEKYQFLSPGIFMGLTVSLLLFMILYVGISAIAGLEVSYMSFSKEMGPNAQKKQQ